MILVAFLVAGLVGLAFSWTWGLAVFVGLLVVFALAEAAK